MGDDATTPPETATDSANLVAWLADLPLFETLEPDELEEIAELCESIQLEAGENLFEQGDPAEALYALETGRLQVRAVSPAGEDVRLAELDGGTVVGEMSIISGGKRSATVEALEESRLIQLRRASFETLRDADRPAAYRLILRLARVLGDRRRETDARVSDVFKDPGEHLEDFEDHVHELLGKMHKA
jgi:NTE family protein